MSRTKPPEPHSQIGNIARGPSPHRGHINRKVKRKSLWKRRRGEVVLAPWPRTTQRKKDRRGASTTPFSSEEKVTLSSKQASAGRATFPSSRRRDVDCPACRVDAQQVEGGLLCFPPERAISMIGDGAMAGAIARGGSEVIRTGQEAWKPGMEDNPPETTQKEMNGGA